MNKIFGTAVVLLLAGCAQGPSASADLRTADHTVAQYEADTDLRGATLDACRGDSDAALEATQQKYPACERAFKAHINVSNQGLDDAVRAENERELQRRAAAKAEKAKKE